MSKKELTSKELTSKVKKIKALQLKIDEIEAEMEALKDEVKAEMTAQGVDEMTVDVFKVRYTKVTTKRFDSTAFKKLHEDIYNMFLKASTSMRFTIS